VEYVTAVPTNAKPAKNGHIFLPSRAAVRKNDSDAYGIMFVCVFVCDIISGAFGEKTSDRREEKSRSFFRGSKFFCFFSRFHVLWGKIKKTKTLVIKVVTL